MKTTRASLLVAAVSAGLLLAACSQGSSPSSASAGHDSDGSLSHSSADAAATRVYAFSDAGGARSRVERTVRSDRSETLHGVTVLSSAAARVTEYVEIDPAGRLVYADVILSQGGLGTEIKRIVADVQSGTVRIRRGTHAVYQRLPVDMPWAYAAWTTARRGEAELQANDLPELPVVTPVAAWVTFRATGASATVRVIDGERETSHEAPADQLVVRGGGDHTIVLGNTAVSASDDFVMALPLGGELSRLARLDRGQSHRLGLGVTRLGAR